ncbi:MAG TPA: hypothetical protein VE912_11910 [Bacteroidales bacterium]|nr:hypothetical protein [Bacteroidales bacterium]
MLSACGLLGNNGDDGPRNIVFSAKDDSGTYQIFVMREDGSGLKQLTNDEFSSSDPAWSQDGQRIAFTSSWDFIDADSARFRQELYLMDTDGSDLQRLTTEEVFIGTISWHPEGRSIAFAASGLHLFDLSEGLVSGIEVNLSEDLRSKVRPVEWSDDGELLLLSVTEEFPKSAFFYLTIIQIRLNVFHLALSKLWGQTGLYSLRIRNTKN